jgi:outer membrane protein assembly factor BamD (BamD/ComL family)
VRRSQRSAPQAAASPLRQEVAFIKEARQALRDGNAARALRLLEECGRLHPAGVLVQERERLAIQALIAGGRAGEASARASEFLRKYPDSPHAGEVRELGRRAAGNR